MPKKITQDYVRSLFDYRDGELCWKKPVRAKGSLRFRAGTPGKDGYVYTTIKGIQYRNHRLVFLYHYGYLPENFIDHIDRDVSNNTIENLREVSASCNSRNANVQNRSRSRVAGVFWDKKQRRWIVQITFNKIRFPLGSSKDLIEAVALRYAGEQCLKWEECNASTSAKKVLTEYFELIKL